MSDIDLKLEREESSTARRQRDDMPHFYMPAMPPLGFIRAVRQRLDAWAFRRKMKRLLDYDDHILDDMGHTRAELMMAIKLPLKENARKVLRQWRDQRRRTG